MPIFDQGYQHWKGTLSGHGWRWLAITRQGVRAQLKNRVTRLIVLAALFPAVVLAGAMALWGLLEQRADLAASLFQSLKLRREFLQSPEALRVPFWTYAYHHFFAAQIPFAMIIVLLVGPNLISQDLRFNALPLYFSRPLRRSDYFLGKLGVIAFFLGAVTVVPAVLAWLLGVAFSLDLSVIADTFPLLVAAVLYGVVIALAAGTLMLGLSSLSRNSRYVAAFWVGLWFVGGTLAEGLGEALRQEWCGLLSFTGNLRRVGDALLGFASARQKFAALSGAGVTPARSTFSEPPEPTWGWSALVLLGLMGLSLWILSLRVKSLDRLK